METIICTDSSEIWRSEFRRNWRKADWSEIATALRDRREHIAPPETLLTAPSEQAFAAQAEALEEEIRQATFPLVPMTRRSSRRKHWWTPELEELHQAMKRALRRRERHVRQHGGTPQVLHHEVEEAKQKLQRKIKERKREAWRTFLVNNSQSTSDLWSTFKRITRSQTTAKLAYIHSAEDGLVEDPTRISALLLQKFFPADVEEEQTAPLYGPMHCPPVSVAEARRGFETGRPYAAPGLDELPNALLRCAFRAFPEQFAALAQTSLCMGYIPPAWQQSLVVPIPKKANPRRELTLFRPISLIGAIAKSVHSIVTHRLAQWLETRGLLSSRQYGFRVGRGTAEALTAAVDFIEKQLGARQIVYGVTLDIRAAFDSLRPRAVLDSLQEMKAPDYLIRWCDHFFRSRRARLDLARGSFWHSPQLGTPQGSPLSPLLFIVGLNPLLNLPFSEGILVQAYADDLLVLGHASSERLVQQKTQETLDLLSQWTTSRGLNFAPEKCCQIRFSRFKRRIPPFPLSINGTQLSHHTAVRYLGLELDDTLSWKPQVQAAARKVHIRLQLLRRCTGSSWGMHPAAVETLVSKAIEPAVFYGSECWLAAGASDRLIAPLESALRKAALCITGGFRTTSYPAAFALAGMRPPAVSLLINALFYETRRVQWADPGGMPPPDRSTSLSSSTRRIAMNRWTRSLPTKLRCLGAPLRHTWSHIPVHLVNLLEGESTEKYLERPEWLLTIALQRDPQTGWLGLSWRLSSNSCSKGECYNAPPWASESEVQMSLLTCGLDALQQIIRSQRCSGRVMGLLIPSFKLQQEITRIRHPSRLAVGIQERLYTWTLAGNSFFWATESWAPGRSPIQAAKLEARNSGSRPARRLQQEIPPGLRWTRCSVSSFLDKLAHADICQRDQSQHLTQWFSSFRRGQFPGRNLDRSEASRLNPFAANHFPSKEYLHRFGERVPDQICLCGAPMEDRDHLLLECPIFSRARQQLNLTEQPLSIALVFTHPELLSEFVEQIAMYWKSEGRTCG